MSNKQMSYEVTIKHKPERKSNKVYAIPKDIVRPSASTMEPVYDDGQYLYKVSPFSFPKHEEFGRLVMGISFLYYGIAKYDKATGRFLGNGYSHTDKQEVQKRMETECKNWKLIDDPYYLYDLRISHGYLY